MMTDDEILAEFRAADALLEGHFILSSGLRSPRYLQCARVLMDPARAERDQGGRTLRYAGRKENASPATGSQARHVKEQRALVRDALTGERTEAAPARP